jgi:hypothetical protein
MQFWKKWRCSGCGSPDDVWAMPIGPKHFDVRLCLPCRRELVRRILHIAISDETLPSSFTARLW